ncbi:MAG TPA: DUF2905 domain-containing protein [Phycicoccus sp.]|nr:DUF2905 domain-containing protein [Phycicoccus sp.]
MGRGAGPVLVGLGVLLVVVGLLAWAGALSWFGHLPGDIRIERPGLRVYVPLASMLVVSLVVSALLWLFRR